MKKTGFTIIELLIVIAVIGAMSTIFVVTFPAGQKRARDTQRKSDLKQYQTAIESYANSHDGLYPRRSDSGGVLAHDTTFCQTDLGYSSSDCPQDPRNGEAKCKDSETCEYRYQSESCGNPGDACATQYVLWSAVELVGDQEYWVVCSNGLSGEVDSGDIPTSGGTCPL